MSHRSSTTRDRASTQKRLAHEVHSARAPGLRDIKPANLVLVPRLTPRSAAPPPASLSVGPLEHVKIVLRAFDTGIWKRVLASSLIALALNVFFRLFGDGVTIALLAAILASSLGLWAHATE